MLALKPNPSFSTVDADKIFGFPTSSPLVFSAYSFNSGAVSNQHDASSCLTGFSGTPGEMWVSGADKRLGTVFTSSGQAATSIIYIWDRQQGCRWYNTVSGELGGQWGTKPNILTDARFRVQSARLSKDGNFVWIEPIGCTTGCDPYYIWEISSKKLTSCGKDSPEYCNTPQALGFGHMINPGAIGTGIELFNRSLNDPGDLAGLLRPPLTPLPNSVSVHLSWQNARSDQMEPVVASIYRKDGQRALQAWENEVVTVRTDGVEPKVWRFCHTRANQGVQPRGAVDQTGAYYMFTSNWEAAVGAGRTDVFIVELRTESLLDSQAPSITGVVATGMSASGATVNWTTNESSDSQVEYGTTTSYGSSSALNTTKVTGHSVALSGLSSGTTYHYRVHSRDAAGNLAMSGNFTFTTTAAPPPSDTAAPIISGMGASGITTSGATIGWTTNEAADTQVEYGTTTSYGSLTALNTAKVTSHSVSLSGLNAGTQYHYRVNSRDAVGNLATSGDASFTTTAASLPPSGSSTIPNFKVAFIGDQGLGSNPTAVLQLIKNEGAQMVLISGDYDYQDTPTAWDNMLTSALGDSFPIFGSIGNHDLAQWPSYQQKLQARLNKISGAQCTGELGVQARCTYQGLFFLLTGAGTLGSGHDVFIRDQLAQDNSIWSVCSWHKNQAAMQVGGKGDEAGWGVYEECRKGGGIIATAHEHSYSRTKTLSSMQSQTVDPAWTDPNVLRVVPGSTFAFVSGLGGRSIRDQQRCLPSTYPYGCNGEWAKIYTSTQGAVHGALFITFHVDGDPRKARGEFKNVNGEVVDSFTIFAVSGTPPPPPPSDTTAPIISGVGPSGITTSGATINWTTNEASDSHVEYGTTTSYSSVSSLDTAKVTSHSVTLSGLNAGTLYNYRVKSRDAAGNLATSSNASLTTAASPSGDTQPPTVSISSPQAGASVSGTVTISAQASDIGGGVAGVQFFANGQPVGSEDTSSPYSVSWNTTTTTNGSYSLTARARDNAGNTATSAAVGVTASNGTTSGRTWNVPGDFVTIQAAINAAASGDKVLVAAGTYAEALTINKVITLEGANYRTNVSELRSNPARLNGNVSVTGGTSAWNQGPVIRGLYINGADPVKSHSLLIVEYCYLHATSGDGLSFESSGGGIGRFNLIETSADDTIDVDHQTKHIWIEGNILLNAGQDGLETRQHNDTIQSLVRLTFINNWVEGSGHDGIQIMDYNNNSNREYYIAHNVFVGNQRAAIGIMPGDVTAEDYGAAPMPERMYLFNNTFVNNTAGLSGGANVIAVNNIFADSDGSFLFELKNVTGSSIVAYSLFRDQTGMSGTVNLDAATTKYGDPLFDSTYRLQSGSPAIDAGTATYSHGGQTVLQIPSSEFSGAAPDLGAFESGLAPAQTGDTTAPSISGVTATGMTASGATINWTTNEPADRQVEYGTSTAYGSATPVGNPMSSSHSMTLSGLQAATQYHYRVKSRDAAGNLATSGNFTFTTGTTTDSTPPTISGVGVSGITTSGATINWTTNELADRQVEYGTSTAYGSATPVSNPLSNSHSVALSGLNAGTLYHYRVNSRDAAGNLASSGDFTFTTANAPAGDTTAPVISGVSATGISTSGATINWTTNEASDSQAEYGTSTSYGRLTALNASLVTSHAAVLSGLTAGAQYHYRVKSRDAAGNLATSANFTLTTQSASTGATAPLVAFPGADGFGAQTKGGRGGRVIYVTNLNDSGAGSLRACLTASGPRNCVFRVSGTIALQDDIAVTNPFLTIAGQSAPGQGVQMKGGMMRIQTHDVVIRYLKMRPGDEINSSNNGDRNAILLSGNKAEVYNVIIDHSTMVWGPDTGGFEAVDNVHDVTVQYSINGEGLYFSNHYEGSRAQGHSKGARIAMNGSVPPKRITMHHNLVTTSSDRNPMWSHGPQNQDFVNNVVYNWSNHPARGDPASLNFINNMYVRGPETNALYAIRAETSAPAIYEEGTVVDGFSQVRAGTTSAYVSTRFAPYSMRTVQTAREAYDQVVAHAGASRPARDSDDQRIISNLVNRTGRFMNGVAYGLTWPTLASGTPFADTDNDGIDDAWEIQHFGNLSRGGATDSSSDFDGDGYTDLEEFLNGTNPKVRDTV